MKKVILLNIFIIALITSTSFCQTKNIAKANSLLEKNELKEALVLIEPATLHEKTKKKGRAWYVRGLIYEKIFNSDDIILKKEYPNALILAAESLKKTIELENEGSTYHGLATIGYDKLYGTILNNGVENYQNKEYTNAYTNFINITKIAPDDTLGWLYSAMMAQELNKHDDALYNYKKLFALNNYSENSLNSVIFIYLNKKDNPEKALEYVKIAQNKFPNIKNYKRQEVDILIKMDKLEDAIVELKNAINKEPENALLISNLAMLYDMTNDYINAEVYYLTALKMDEKNRNALINLSVLYIGNGDRIMKEVNDMSIKEYTKFIDDAEKKANIEYNKSIPLLNRVLVIDENDELGLQNMQAVYAKLKNGKKANEIYKKRIGLGYITEN